MTAEEWIHRGESLSALGKYDEAIGCFDTAIKVKPKDTSAWDYKGATLIIQGKYDEAIMCFDTAIMINPKDETAIEGRRRCRRRLLSITNQTHDHT